MDKHIFRGRGPALTVLVCLYGSGLFSPMQCDADEDRLRLMIETDAGGDPDDEQSLVRFLLYANEWDIEGIIANRAQTRRPENSNPEGTGLGIVRRLLTAYGECWPQLSTHDSRYPPLETLWTRTIAGDSETDAAVERIIELVDANDPRPLWYSDWGSDHGSGKNNLHRALDRVLAERGPEGYARFKSRLRLSSADAFGPHTHEIEPPFPLWVDTFSPEIDGHRWYHQFAPLTSRAGGFDLERDLRSGHGALGELYPLTPTPQKEGDSATFLYLVPTGLGDPLQPTWGSWAGRYGLRHPDSGCRYYWADQLDAWNGSISRENTLGRFASALQNDFRARLDWCVSPRETANHPPNVNLKQRLGVTVNASEVITLDASATSDPDGDRLAFEWWVYREAGNIEEDIDIHEQNSPVVVFRAPGTPGELHVVLTVRDDGNPPLERYGRCIITIARVESEAGEVPDRDCPVGTERDGRPAVSGNRQRRAGDESR